MTKIYISDKDLLDCQKNVSKIPNKNSGRRGTKGVRHMVMPVDRMGKAEKREYVAPITPLQIPEMTVDELAAIFKPDMVEVTRERASREAEVLARMVSLAIRVESKRIVGQMNATLSDMADQLNDRLKNLAASHVRISKREFTMSETIVESGHQGTSVELTVSGRRPRRNWDDENTMIESFRMLASQGIDITCSTKVHLADASLYRQCVLRFGGRGKGSEMWPLVILWMQENSLM